MAKKVLVVDDDVQTLKLVGLVLEREGYEIVAARKGQQALDKAETLKPDLIVLDVMMPDISGYEVARQLRAKPNTAGVPILMFTAKGQVEDKVTGFEAGADDYLTKPVHPKELVSRAETLMLRSARTQPAEEGPPPNSIAFVGSKGGTGTTTLAVNAAVALAMGPAKDRRVIFAELRSGLATAAHQLEFSRHGRIERILQQPIGKIDAALVEAQLDQHGTGLFVLTGQPKPPGVAEPISPEHAEVIVQRLGNLADYVLLDLGVGLDEVNRRIIPDCRRIVVTIEPDRMNLALAEELLDALNQSLNVPSHRTHLVLINRSRSATSLTKSAIEEMLGHTLAGMIPAAPELSFQATKGQTPVVIANPDSFVARQYATVARDLIEDL